MTTGRQRSITVTRERLFCWEWIARDVLPRPQDAGRGMSTGCEMVVGTGRAFTRWGARRGAERAFASVEVTGMIGDRERLLAEVERLRMVLRVISEMPARDESACAMQMLARGALQQPAVRP